MAAGTTRGLVLALVLGMTAACGSTGDQGTLSRSAVPAAAESVVVAAAAAEPPPEPVAVTEPATTVPTATTEVPVVAPPTSAAPPPPPPPVRPVHEQAWTPFAAVESVVLHHPSTRVEAVGFHESNHDGAREMQPLPTAANPLVLESRERGTGARTAADIVSDPDIEVRAPVTGQVRRAGTYVLYCDYSDDYAVIEPDARPGWEVKILHIDGVRVRAGDRVVAGETVLADRPTRLPFESQVDERSTPPAWPHVHIEVVDPSIPDRPSPGGGC
ncbi:MAG: hypothetical protein WD232_00985 [Acidimicrobiales bacterium]